MLKISSRHCSEKVFGILVLLLPLAAQAADPLNGRLLASQCYQCHGTNGRGGIENIAGDTSYGDLLEYKYSALTPDPVPAAQKARDIMQRQMRGYTDAELQAISLYLGGGR
jgi:sulfide dehydrogenase cytochrome subunit